ncbi:MAG: DUF2922 family protein [Defluviitaleaceae bacterium]|nr:DUF2922 family protein [Defluviitaleaceae bacterium]
MGVQLVMGFGTTGGRTRNLRINNINQSALNNSIVRNSMQSIMASGAVAGSGGAINSLRRAFTEETIITVIELAEA